MCIWRITHNFHLEPWRMAGIIALPGRFFLMTDAMPGYLA
jgi:hypothetical protein